LTKSTWIQVFKFKLVQLWKNVFTLVSAMNYQNWKFAIVISDRKLCRYSHVHISSDEVFSKILKEPYCRNRWYLIWTGCFFALRWRKKKCEKKNQNGRLKNKYIWIRLQTGVKWLFLAQFGLYLKTQKGQTCLPLLPEILKTAPAVIKKSFWGDKQSLQGCRFNYWPY
jgi:hypothetical protein